MDCQRCLCKGVDYNFKDLSAKFLKFLSAYGGGVPSQRYLNSSGSRVVLWAWGSSGSISYWLCYYSVDNAASLLAPEVSQGL